MNSYLPDDINEMRIGSTSLTNIMQWNPLGSSAYCECVSELNMSLHLLSYLDARPYFKSKSLALDFDYVLSLGHQPYCRSNFFSFFFSPESSKYLVSRLRNQHLLTLSSAKGNFLSNEFRTLNITKTQCGLGKYTRRRAWSHITERCRIDFIQSLWLCPQLQIADWDRHLISEQ